MYSLKNDQLKINIKHKGAELCNIIGVKSCVEFLWQANPNIWGSHAPNLFPIIGAMKDDTYFFDDKKYNMPKHGFVRHNNDFKVVSQSETKITFKIDSNISLKAIYPFEFEFLITYELINNVLRVHHIVNNTDTKSIFFSLGGHPAFNCPLYENENYTDYFLKFENHENSKSYLLNMKNGLITEKTKRVIKDGNIIQLRPNLFDNDALIFKDLSSRKVTLTHKTNGDILSVMFKDFPYLGIWAKPKAPYVCIEPWIGIADLENTNQHIIEKEGIISLADSSSFSATYSVEIDKSHLV
ncbi:aldose 1-epimerase family protein [Ichthyenterobacterium sp. W332]|uniref:Aldose 1-epimerase family protein n=1 Tax=Microcosmobacter mediterraneus TaxID=3075607 RepID=A0ABU2YKR0_9FLAO|nr:aldose 1-epimerase family protein [Ichthyenterobacterium sp. W332]MDT0558757.1 aldose 1-epimerase family protein [Ichthyenterobacterium sp. W332]